MSRDEEILNLTRVAAELVKRRSRSCQRHFLGLGDDDLVQMAAQKCLAYESDEHKLPPSPSYLARMVQNAVIDEFRRNRRYEELPKHEPASKEQEPLDVVAGFEQQKNLLEAISLLSAQDQALFELETAENLAQGTEVANETESQKHYARVRLSRVRKRLRSLIRH